MSPVRPSGRAHADRHGTRRAEHPVSRVAEARHDVAVIVQPVVDRARDDPDARMGGEGVQKIGGFHNSYGTWTESPTAAMPSGVEDMNINGYWAPGELAHSAANNAAEDTTPAEIADLPSNSNTFTEAVGISTDEDGWYDIKM